MHESNTNHEAMSVVSSLAGMTAKQCETRGQSAPHKDGMMRCAARPQVTAVGFEPTPFRNGALSHRLRPLGQTVLVMVW